MARPIQRASCNSGIRYSARTGQQRTMAYRCLERASRHRCARGPAGCIPTARIRLQTVEYTECVHPRPSTGFADLLRRGILPERDADLTGIHIAVRSVQWIAWRSSSCSHRRRRHGLHQSRRSFDRTGTYRGVAARADWHSARFSDSLVGLENQGFPHHRRDIEDRHRSSGAVPSVTTTRIQGGTG